MSSRLPATKHSWEVTCIRCGGARFVSDVAKLHNKGAKKGPTQRFPQRFYFDVTMMAAGDIALPHQAHSPLAALLACQPWLLPTRALPNYASLALSLRLSSAPNSQPSLLTTSLRAQCC